MKKIIISWVLVFTILNSGFSSSTNEVSEKTNFIINETETSVTYINKFGLETKVTKSPKRVVIVFNSILGLWYYTGGTAIARVKGKVNVPPEARDITDLGSTKSLSIEAIIAMEPNLVILPANYEALVSMAPMLMEMGIEVMIIDTSINSYERFLENADLFSRINKTESLFNTKISPIVTKIDKIIYTSGTIKDKPKVAAIFATSKSMSLESDIALTGEMIKLLGGENILKKSDVFARGETRVSFSIESIITQNPDIIMFSSMGSEDVVKKNIDKMINDNPVWSEVNAVKNNRVYFLPKQYSVYKPNQLYAEAFLHIAEIIYPEEFGE